MLPKTISPDEMMKLNSAPQLPKTLSVSDMQNLNNGGAVTTPDDHKGIFQTVVQDLATPFMKIPATITSGFVPAVFDVFGKHETANKLRDYAIKNGIDYGYLGKVKPFGADQFTAMKAGEITPGTAALRTGEEMLSDGAQIASWFIGLGEEKAVLEGTEGAAALSGKAKLWNTVLKTTKEALPFSLLQGVGAGLSDLSKGEGVGKSAGDTAASVAGNIAGFFLFKGAGDLLTRAAGSIIRSPVVAAANKALIDTMSKVFGTDVEKMSPTIVREISQEVDSQHKELIKGIGDAIKTKTTPEELWKGITSKAEPYVDEAFKQPETIFKDFYAKAPAITMGEDSATMEVVQKGNELLDKMYGKVAEVPSGKISTEAFKAAQESADSASARAGSPLQQLITMITDKIGPDGKKPISAQDVERLVLKKELISGRPTQTEESIMNQFEATLKKDMLSFLNKSPETKPLVELYRQGQKAADFNASVLGDVVMKSVRDASTHINDFLDSAVLGKAPNERTAQTLLDALGGPGSKEQKQFSELLFNRIIEKAQTMTTNTTEGGKFIQSFIEKWQNTGLLNLEHLNTLDKFGEFMQNKSGDYLNALRSITGELKLLIDSSGELKPDLTSKAADLEAKTSQVKALKTFTKSLGDKPLFTDNGDGTLNMNNLLDSLRKANTDEKTFNGLIESFSKVNPEKVPINKAKSLIKTGLGTTLIGMGHTWWGAAMTSKGLGELFSTEGKVSAKEVANMAADLVGKIDEKTGKPYLDASLMTDLMSDKFSTVKRAIKRLTQASTGKVVTPDDNQ